MIILDTNKASPEQVTLKVEDIISTLTDYSFEKQVKQPGQTDLMKFLQ